MFCHSFLNLDNFKILEGNVMSYGLYIVGFLIVIGGLIYGAVLLHVLPQWIVVGSVVLLGIAILTGVKAARQKYQS